MSDDWRKAYLQFGCQWVEPLEYLPCPGSVSCSRVISKTGDDDKDEGPTYPKEMSQ